MGSLRSSHLRSVELPKYWERRLFRRRLVCGGRRKVRKDGAQGRNRTTDTVIFSHVLYQLSYLGAAPTGRRVAGL
jgi:hypothetical protein